MTVTATYGVALAAVIGIMAATPLARRSKAGAVRSAGLALGPLLGITGGAVAILALRAADGLTADPLNAAVGLAFGGGAYLVCLLLARPPESGAIGRSLGAFITGAAAAALPLVATAANVLHTAGIDETEAWRLATAPGTAATLLLALAAGHALASGGAAGYAFALAGAGTVLFLNAEPGLDTVIAAALVVVGGAVAAVPDRFRFALALAGAAAVTLAVTYNHLEKGVTG